MFVWEVEGITDSKELVVLCSSPTSHGNVVQVVVEQHGAVLAECRRIAAPRVTPRFPTDVSFGTVCGNLVRHEATRRILTFAVSPVFNPRP